MGTLLGFLFVLGIVAVIGHGIWVAVAWLFTAGQSAATERAGGSPSMHCPACRSALLWPERGCPSCGWPRPASAGRRLAAGLNSLARELARLKQVGLLDQTSFERLTTAVETERASLAAPLKSLGLATDEPAAAIAGPAVAPITNEAYARVEPIPAVDAAASTSRVPSAVVNRAQRYVHEREADLREPEPEPEPDRPTMHWSDLLVHFMEEKNIRWGELIGGLLIVCCSIALVISFWSQIAQRPFLKFFLFNGVTAGLFGVGFYIHRRWKLRTTSQGLLTIGTLLVPLNFLAIAAFSQGAAPTSLWLVGGEAVSVVLFAVLVYGAGFIIASHNSIALAVGVVGSAVAELLVRRWVGPDAALPVIAGVWLIPLACYIASTGTAVARTRRWLDWGESETSELFTLLGTASFSAAVALGLLLVKTGAAWTTLCRMAPLASMTGVPALAVGLLVMRKLKQPELASLRTAATTIGVIGSGLLIAGLALGWTHPASLVLVGAVDCLVFAAVAIVLEIPAAMLLSVAALVPGWLAAFHIVAGHIDWRHATNLEMAYALASAASGSVLVPLAALMVGLAWWLSRIGRAQQARFLTIAAAAVAVGSLTLVIGFGFGRAADAGAAWVLLFYAVVFLAAGARFGPMAVWTGSSLLLAALVQGFVFRYIGWLGFDHPWIMAMLGHSTVMMLTAGWMSGWRERNPQRGGAWHDSALLSSVAAAPLIVDLVGMEGPGQVAGYSFWLAADWLALAWLRDSASVFSAFQLALSFAVAMAAAAWSPAPSWLDPRRLQAQGVAIAMLNGAWIVVRIALRRFPAPQRLLCPAWPSVDRLLTGVLVAGLVALACYGALPGIAHELAPRTPAIEASNWVGTLAIRGMPAERALGVGSWLLMIALVGVLVARQWERFSSSAILAAMLVLWTACALVAGRIPDATASMLRWGTAGYALLLSTPIWLRERVLSWTRLAAWPEMESRCAWLAQAARAIVLLLGVVPVLALTLVPALSTIAGEPLVGPAQDSFFARIGSFWAFLVPLALVCLVLLGHAIRERSSAYAFAAGLVLNLATSLGYLLPVVMEGGPMGTIVRVRLLEFNALASGGFALAWLAATAWWRHRREVDEPEKPDSLLFVQSGLSAVLVLLLVGPNLLQLVSDPGSGLPLFEVAGLWGWSASLVPLAAVGWCGSRFVGTEEVGRRVSGAVACALMTAASLSAFEASRWDVGNWLAFHTLLASWLGVAALLLIADITLCRRGGRALAAQWTAWVAGFGCLLALRAGPTDPDRPWWSVGALTVLAGIFAGLACVAGWRKGLWIAAGLANLAATIWWIQTPLWQPMPPFPAALLVLLEVNAVALALPALAWLAIDLRFLQRERPAKIGVHSFAAMGSLVVLACVTAISLAANLNGMPLPTNPLLNWLTVGAVAIAISACLWDGQTRWPVTGLYVLGLVGLGVAVEGYKLSPRWLFWTGGMLAAAYSLATSYLWSRRQGLLAIAGQLGIPRRSGPSFSGVSWLVPANWALASLVMAACFIVMLTFPEQPLRFVSGNAAIVQAVAVGLLARGRRKSQLRAASLWFAVLGAIAWGWAWIHPASPERALDRSVVVTVAIAAMAIIYGTAGKFLPATAWTASARRLLPSLLALGGVSLCVVVAMEATAYATSGQVMISWPALLAVAIALLALACAAIVAAVVPGRDPLHLSESGRTAYVYAAEGLLALVLLHVRLTLPWLFSGIFLRYWPVLVVLVAFLGVGLAEFFRRKRQAVLAMPLERTGVLLPLLPVLGYWAAPAVDVHYSLELLAVGMLYAVLSVTRRSFGFGLLAALAANGGLWFFLNEQGRYGLLVHPQLWLIPPAVCVLLAAYLNRDQLDDAQMTTIRYLSAVTIYVSSTADIFLNGVAQAPWLPLVLAGLALAGVALGILLQVRAFLFLGTAFLALSLFTIIWHAAVDLEQTWLWAATGIVTGILIIAVFAAFEKKRDDVLVLIERLRQWEM